MADFIQIHSLVAHGPSNLNRDDMGRPKTVIFGGATRLRISSQSLKRAWRTSTAFDQEMGGHLSDRTALFGEELHRSVATKATDDAETKKIQEAVVRVAERFGKIRTPETGRIEQLAFISKAEQEAAKAMLVRILDGEEIKDKEIDAIVGNVEEAVDIAMFGRMLASRPSANVEAAVQVAHAITTHACVVEDDYYTAVDDLKNVDDSRGAGHVGEAEFGAGVFYEYVCIDRGQLVKNLGGNEELASRACSALVKAMIEHGPKAKQASFGSFARPIFVLAERGAQQPRNLMAAFIDPVNGRRGSGADAGQGDASIKALKGLREKMDKVYGPCSDRSVEIDAMAGTGSVLEIYDFVG